MNDMMIGPGRPCIHCHEVYGLHKAGCPSKPKKPLKMGQEVWVVVQGAAVDADAGRVARRVSVEMYYFLHADGETAALVTSGHRIGGNSVIFAPLGDVMETEESAKAAVEGKATP